MSIRFYFILSLLLISTGPQSFAQMDSIDIQGHRGCRGLMPENSLPGFLHAIDIGVHTLEMDVVISKEKTWFVSHEPWLNHEICTDIEGRKIDATQEQTYNLYWLRDIEIKSCDCGAKGNKRFPEQQPMATTKPTLREVFDACENHPTPHGSPIRYNIEIKSQEAWEGKFHPPVDEYVELFIQFMDSIEFIDRITIQSFDMRVLRILNEKRPNWKLSLLVDNFWPMRYNMKRLGFKPHTYSPYFKRITKRSVSKAKDDGVKLIPWTVNEISDMQRLIDWGVDGLITDYPNRLVELVGSTKSTK